MIWSPKSLDDVSFVFTGCDNLLMQFLSVSFDPSLRGPHYEKRHSSVSRWRHGYSVLLMAITNRPGVTVCACIRFACVIRSG